MEYICSLNRLRDKQLENISNYKTIEICRNADKVLDYTDNDYEYERITIKDNYLYDENNKGIIDELVRMITVDTFTEQTNFKYDNFTRQKTYGCYLKYKKVKYDESHPFDLLFQSVNKAYRNTVEKGKKEKLNLEDNISKSNLMLLEILYGENKQVYDSIKSIFNINLMSLFDWKKMLLDVSLSKNIKQYITKCIVNTSRNYARQGRNEDYVTVVTKKNGVKTVEYKQNGFHSLDAPMMDDKDRNNSNRKDLLTYTHDEGIIIDSEHELDSILENNEYDENNNDVNIYTYIYNNIQKILTNNQLNYFNDCLSGNSYKYNSDTKSKYKKEIKKNIQKFLNNDNNVFNDDDKYKLLKNNLSDTLYDILNCENNKSRFDKLVYYMKLDNYISDRLCDVIFELDLKYTTPLSNVLIDNDDVDVELYIKTGFIHVLNALNSHFNFISNKDEIFLLNEIQVSSTELEIKKYIDTVILNNNDSSKLPRKSINGYTSMDELTNFLNEKLNTDISKNKIRNVLNQYGYEISNKASLSVNGYPAYKVYKLPS